ncbi:VOC family protein [Candidatus Peregrinibacteria bacterium]|nr:VOC family protein [Candidatus Peregrinibacteria bacterium]
MKAVAVWFEIYVDDLDRATKFYETVLNTKLEPLGNPADSTLKMMSFPGDMEKYGCGGALVKMNGVKSGGNSTLVYFGSEDCVTEEARVVNAGGQIMKNKMSIVQYGFISICIDTEGNMFGLHSMK